MGLYVYGLTSDPRPLRTRGLFNRPLRAVQIGSISVIVETSVRTARPTMTSLRKQGGVVAALVARGVDMLPARFGTFVADRAALERAVNVQRPALARALKLIRGRVQMTVRVRLGQGAAQKALPRWRGTAYLRSKNAHARRLRRDPVVRAIQRAAQGFAKASQVEWRDGEPAVARLHHLIARNRIADYEEAVGRAIYVRGSDATISGPWAPFAFAEVE